MSRDGDIIQFVAKQTGLDEGRRVQGVEYKVYGRTSGGK